MPLKVDAVEIECMRTPNGGWTKKQLAQWGVPWPPPKGWRRALENGWRIPGGGLPVASKAEVLDDDDPSLL